jgi:hypothetical protein
MNRARPVTTTAQIALDLVAGEIAGALTGDDPLAPELFASVALGGMLTPSSDIGAGRLSSAGALPRRPVPDRRAVRHAFGCE